MTNESPSADPTSPEAQTPHPGVRVKDAVAVQIGRAHV